MQPLASPDIPGQIASASVAADQTSVRIGKVTAFTPDGSITVAVSGSNVLAQATYLSSYVPSAGDQVAIIRSGATWLVLGTMGQTRSRLLPVVAYEGTSGNISLPTVTYGDLDAPANPGPAITINVGSSGQALLMWQTEITTTRGTVGYSGGRAAVAISGANTDTPHDSQSFGYAKYQYVSGAPSLESWNSTFSRLYTGLNPGLTTFTLKYMRYDSGASATAKERTIMGWAY